MSLTATTTVKHRWGAQAPPAKAQIKPQTRVYDHLPHLPPYSVPKTGFVAHLPKSWIPYAQLMRLDRPAGFYAFYIPYSIGTVYSACIASSNASIASVIGFLAFLVPLNIVLRGIGCAFNDNVDQNFDRKVTRCRHRPIARGAINTSQAHLFTLALTLLLVPFVAWLPQSCWLQMSGITVMFCLYTLAKRVTYYPQVVLGIPFSWAVFFCLADSANRMEIKSKVRRPDCVPDRQYVAVSSSHGAQGRSAPMRVKTAATMGLSLPIKRADLKISNQACIYAFEHRWRCRRKDRVGGARKIPYVPLAMAEDAQSSVGLEPTTALPVPIYTWS